MASIGDSKDEVDQLYNRQLGIQNIRDGGSHLELHEFDTPDNYSG